MTPTLRGIQEKQLSPDVQRVLENARGFPRCLPRIQQTLSAAGWVFGIRDALWKKDGGSISEEWVYDLAQQSAGARDWIMAMLVKGAISFICVAGETDDGRFQTTFAPIWPNVVDALKRVKTEDAP